MLMGSNQSINNYERKKQADFQLAVHWEGSVGRYNHYMSFCTFLIFNMWLSEIKIGLVPTFWQQMHEVLFLDVVSV